MLSIVSRSRSSNSAICRRAAVPFRRICSNSLSVSHTFLPSIKNVSYPVLTSTANPKHFTQIRQFTSSLSSLKHIKYEVNPQGIALVRIDCKDAKVNTLSREVFSDFEVIANQVNSDPNVKAAVVISNKSDNFIAGADISMLTACKNASEVQELSENGQKLLNTVAASKKPFVAAIHGSCLGGGLEVALACHYRVASESPKTVLGLPEVQLGLLPGAGGTQRLPKIVGLQAALDMALTGKNIRSTKAIKMGLVDQLTDPKALEPASIEAALALVDGTRKPYQRKRSYLEWALEATPLQSVVFSQAKKMIDKNTGGHYPAPYAILEVIKTGLNSDMATGLKKEATEFSRLSQTPVSKSLTSIFFAQTGAKKNRFADALPSQPAKTIAVLGAGLMGAGITQVSAVKDFKVLLYDRDVPSLARGTKQIYDSLYSSVKKKSITEFELNRNMSNIIPFNPTDSSLNAQFKNVDVLIEAIPEDLSLKHKVLGDFEKILPPHAVIASNTSALPIADIGKGLKDPSRLIGMHYFSPVEKMPLLEIITTKETSKIASAVAVDVGIKQGKVVIVVNDGPGFYTTRILAPLCAEAVALLEQGAPVAELEKSLKKFGFPVGPVTLIDEVGIDVGKHVSDTMIKTFGERMGGPNRDSFVNLINAGFLGRKNGKGFYIYGDKKSKKNSKELNEAAVKIIQKQAIENVVSVEEMQNRMVLRFVNEAILCLQENILTNPTDGDLGAVFGLGFPPFLGGPFRYVDSQGAGTILSRLEVLHNKYGIRFKPAEMLVEYAKSGKSFHPK